MTRFRVRASGPLEGRVEVAGATKNSGVKQMAAALLAPGVTTLRNMPSVLDLDVMSDLLRAVGAVVDQPAPNVVRVDASGTLQPEAPYELVSRMRASFNVLGPLLARCGEARIALPGGDNIGSRKVDMHLRGLESMGAEVEVVHGYVNARCDALQGARVVLEFPSVGATENLMCAAVLAKGTTVIENAAREPEVTDLAAFLDRMGAQVTGAGTATIEISTRPSGLASGWVRTTVAPPIELTSPNLKMPTSVTGLVPALVASARPGWPTAAFRSPARMWGDSNG